MADPVPSPAMRAGVFTAMCAGLSLLGHSAVSGHGPALVGVLLGVAATALVARALTCRERGLGTIFGWLLWGQLALHVVFELTTRVARPDASAHHAEQVAVPAAEPAHAAAWMLLAHLVAVAAGAWWLRRGERAAFLLLGLLAERLAGPLRVLWAAPPRRAVRRPRPVALPTPEKRPSPPYMRVAVPRGPPVPIRSA